MIDYINIFYWLIRYIAFPTLILFLIYLRMRWFSFSELNEWKRNTIVLTGTVLEVLRIRPEGEMLLQNPLILKVSYKVCGEEVITYVDDKNLVYRSWLCGDWIILRVLKSDPRQCHYKKYADEKPTSWFKACYCFVSLLGVMLFFMMYIAITNSGYPVLAVWFLIPAIIFANVVIEFIASFLEQYQNSFERILNNLKQVGGL